MLVRIDDDTGCVCKLVSPRRPHVSKCEKDMPNNLVIHIDHWESLLRFVDKHNVHLCNKCWKEQA